MNPSASAPASAAATPSSALVMPQILTFTDMLRLSLPLIWAMDNLKKTRSRAHLAGLFPKWRNGEKVGRAVPCTPVERTKTQIFDCVCEGDGAQGTAGPACIGFGQQSLATTTRRAPWW